MTTSQDTNIQRFNTEAATWDSNHDVVNCSKLALDAILKHVPELLKYKESGEKDDSQGLNVLEIGCGTGLMSFMIAPYVKTLLGVDITPGMIGAFNAKLVDAKVQRNPLADKLSALCLIVADPDDPTLQSIASTLIESRGFTAPKPVRWDLITSHLTLHHIPSLQDILATTFHALKPGGRIALTDFEDFGEDAVLFHPESKRAGVERHGIKKVEMEIFMKEAGFVNVKVLVEFSLEKKVEEREDSISFPFLLCLGTKP